MSNYSLEHFMRAYDDKSGDYVQVSEDGDGLGLVQLLVVDFGKEYARFTMPPEQASLVATAINKLIAEIEGTSPKATEPGVSQSSPDHGPDEQSSSSPSAPRGETHE